MQMSQERAENAVDKLLSFDILFDHHYDFLQA